MSRRIGSRSLPRQRMKRRSDVDVAVDSKSALTAGDHCVCVLTLSSCRLLILELALYLSVWIAWRDLILFRGL